MDCGQADRGSAHGCVGHFHVRLTNFTRTCLAFEIARKRNTYVEVSCSLDAVEFKEVQRIVNIIFDQHGVRRRSVV